MPRISRKNSQSNFHHIMVQGLNKEFIFKKEEDMKKYREIIIEKLNNSDITILAYCIMSNHTHFLIYSDKYKNLSRFMQRVNTSYSRWYNKENKRVGYVFRDRFYSQDILNENQLYNCLRYIHNNPVKAKIVKNMDEYKYSSYNEFVGGKIIITNESIKLIFGKSKKYKNQFLWIHNKCVNDDFIDIEENKQDILVFINNIEKKYNKKIDEIKKDTVLLENIIKEAKIKTNVTIIQLAKILNMSKSTIGRYLKKKIK